MKKVLLLFALLIGISANLYSQVVSTPTIIYIDKETKTAHLTIENKSTKSQEVEIKFKFGYPIYDSLGARKMFFIDSGVVEKYDITSNIRAFPKKFVLAPKTQQTVRITLKDAKKLIDDGGYYTRVSILSKEEKPQVDTTGKVKDKISVGMVFAFEALSPMFFNKGDATTSINILDVKKAQDSANVKIFIDVEKGGNAPYLGSAFVEIYDDKGELVDKIKDFTGIYINKDRPCYTFKKDKFKPGKYKVDVTFKSVREDINPNDLIKCAPSAKSIYFEVE